MKISHALLTLTGLFVAVSFIELGDGNVGNTQANGSSTEADLVENFKINGKTSIVTSLDASEKIRFPSDSQIETVSLRTIENMSNGLDTLPNRIPVWVTANSLNGRSGPGKEFGVIGTFEIGSSFFLTGKTEGEWWQVASRTQSAVWMHRNFLALTPPLTPLISDLNNSNPSGSEEQANTLEPADVANAIAAPDVEQTLSFPPNSEIIQNIINTSIANYSGPCACPYNRASNGSKCGRRSAYSKPGGYVSVCYIEDVTLAMIESWKSRRRGASISN